MVKKKTSGLFVDFTAVYDTVWHCGFTCKLLCLLDRHMVSLIMELVCYKVLPSPLILKKSRLWCLKNGFLQGSVLAPLLFNIYTYDLPVTVEKKFAYADEPAILHYASNWQASEETLAQDMATLSFYLYKWKFNLSTTKIVQQSSIFTTRRHDMSLASFSTDRPHHFVLNPFISA